MAARLLFTGHCVAHWTKATLAEEASQGVQPEEHSLQAYPSISSGLATVTFVLDQEEAYTLGLYNLNGTLVQKIGEGRAQAARR